MAKNDSGGGSATEAKRVWQKVLDPNELPDGRVKPVSCSHTTVCMTRHDGQYAALDNKCPHQGGPLGEGSIENGLLRCPWHGWDFDPITGKPPGGYDDGVATYPVEVRDDGIYVGFDEEAPHAITVTDVMAELGIHLTQVTPRCSVGPGGGLPARPTRIRVSLCERGGLPRLSVRLALARWFPLSKVWA